MTTGGSVASRALRAGRLRIERGWCQGVDFREQDGAYEFCVATASMDTAVRWTLAQVLAPERDPYGNDWQECPDATDMLVAWNDEPGRTHEEVVALYDAAIWAVENGREPGWPPPRRSEQASDG